MDIQTIETLLEQAASSLTLLDATDTSKLLAFEEVVGQLSTLSAEAAQTDDILKTFHHVSTHAAQLIQQLVAAPNEETNSTLDTITAAVMEMQQLLDQTAVPTSQTAAAFCQDDIPLIQDFIMESREHIESAETALLELENDPENSEVLNQIFRSFHTIKGMAGFLNLTDINGLAHSAENLLDLARKGQLKLTGANCDAVFASIDLLKDMLTDLEKAIGSGTGLSAPAGLDALLDRLHQCTSGQAQAVIPITDEPVLDKESNEMLEVILDAPQDPESDRPRNSAAAGTVEKIKVNTTKLDELINMTGELAIAQLMIAEEVKNINNDSDLFRKVAQQNKIVRELQELSMSMRMVPIQGAFQKMSRLVRDLSKKANKRIEFITSGEETELDRNIVDKITDPLVHMMRNSVDHGIETVDERMEKGKPAQGQVHLSAYHQAGNIVIKIQDDGRGLHREKLIKKALEKGLISEHQELSDDEAFKLIFHAGFSTAEKISDVSGRGVGMDVVRKNIESLGGKIDIHSIPNEGTTFIIRLPLTLAIIDGQIVTVGDQRYIIPINSIVGSVRPTEGQISTVQTKGEVVMIRGELIPIIRMSRLFSVRDAIQNTTDALLVVVEEGGRKSAVLVDDLIGQQQVVIKKLSGLGKIKGVSGGAIMGDGHVSLILDIPGLIDIAVCSDGTKGGM
jgi:two-component system chemotaxis sensor kinase CheA